MSIDARTARIFHARHPERFPAAVLLAQTEQDVVEGVRLVRERGWKVGSNRAGTASRSGPCAMTAC